MCLQLLQDQPGITAERLARGLGCSPRAARRNVAILREAGMPGHSTRGRYRGGARSAGGGVSGGSRALGQDPAPVGAALGKVVRALPSGVAEQVQAIRRTTAPAPD